jgi:hypothetical protein
VLLKLTQQTVFDYLLRLQLSPPAICFAGGPVEYSVIVVFLGVTEGFTSQSDFSRRSSDGMRSRCKGNASLQSSSRGDTNTIGVKV